MKNCKLIQSLPVHTWMGRWGNTRKRVMGSKNLVSAAWVVGVVMGVVLVAPAVQAQEAASEVQIDAPLLDTSHAQRAYRQVEAWLGEAEGTRQDAHPIRVTGLIGVKLVLRSSGIVVGEGEAYRDDLLSALDGPGHSVDLMPLLLSATQQAEADVREGLADARLRSVLAGRNLRDSEEVTLAEVSSNLSVDLELGYGLRTVTVPADADPDEVYARFAPCYHGLAFVDAKKGAWSWVWPGDATSRNITPSSQLVLGLKGLSMDRLAVTELARPGGAGLARFKTIHMVRPFAGAQPTVLVRSSVDLPRYAVSERELESMGDRLIEHLFNRFTTDGQVRGTYHPTSGRFDPLVASDDQTALACYAMVHHSRYLVTARPFDQSMAAYSRRAMQIATELGERILRDGDTAEPRVMALVLLALLEAPVSQSDSALRDKLGERLIDLVMPKDAKDKVEVNQGADALSAAALATLYERTREQQLGQAVWTLMDRIWGDEDRVPNLVALPWLALAYDRAGDLLADADQSGARRAELTKRRAIFAVVIDRLCQHQVIEKPTLGPEDVLGGFVLRPGPSGSPPNPDWRNAQPLMLLSIVLRDGRVTEGQDKLGWLLSAGYSARFVGQLMMDDAGCYYVRDRVAARGGVRMAPWDNRLALAPTAISLLAVTELQTSLATFRPTPPVPETTPEQVEDDEDDLDDVSAEVTDPPEQPKPASP
jgi:hypothetical protein